MVISANTQLGLRFKDPNVKAVFFELQKQVLDKELEMCQSLIAKFEKAKEDGNTLVNNIVDSSINSSEVKAKALLELKESEEFEDGEKYYLEQVVDKGETEAFVKGKLGDERISFCDGSRYFLIQDTVFKAAELIRINENFTGTALKGIKPAKYTYLLGRHKMIRFVCQNDCIEGFYYDDDKNYTFEWGVELLEGGYYFKKEYNKEFSMIMQLLIFIELGDIEIKYIEPRRTIGKDKATKTVNSTNYTVYVVDSSWNQLLIRTEGFAVRGHFRLQPCGAAMKDRKLIWISAFEKNGYTRPPRARIID